MIITLTQVEADCFKKELNIKTQEELNTLMNNVFKDAAEFITASLNDDGTIQISGEDIYVMNVFSAMRDKIAFVAGFKSIGIGTIKTGMSLIGDIKRDYRAAVDRSKRLKKAEREIQEEMDEENIIVRPRRFGDILARR